MSSAIKRIKADIRELAQHSSSAYSAAPTEDNMFLWHFTIRGPRGTDFEGGVYHGKISLPPEYPFKPPSIMLLTPNGRFETNTKICLSMTDYHPENWQPAWGIRTILEALVAFFPTPAESAIGALHWKPEERIALAAASRNWVCPQCGPISDLLEDEEEEPSPPKREAEYTGKGYVLSAGGTANQQPTQKEGESDPQESPATTFPGREGEHEAEQPLSSPQGSPDVSLPATIPAPAPPSPVVLNPPASHPVENSLIIGLLIAIFALLMKKFLAP